MERVCGTLKTQLKSRVRPYENLLLRALGSEQVRQIERIAQLEDVLHPPPFDKPRRQYAGDFKFFADAGLPDHSPLPARTTHRLTDPECNKISAILSPVVGIPGRLLRYFERAERCVVGWNGCRLGGNGHRVVTKDGVSASTGGQEGVRPRDCSYITVRPSFVALSAPS